MGYINTQYDRQLRPLTSYPAKLCEYLIDRFGFMHGQRLLEVGCGRCEFLNSFGELGSRFMVAMLVRTHFHMH